MSDTPWERLLKYVIRELTAWDLHLEIKDLGAFDGYFHADSGIQLHPDAWKETLPHEFGHFLQWATESPLWDDSEMNGASKGAAEKLSQSQYELEMDADRRGERLLKDFGVEYDAVAYARRAHAHALSYLLPPDAVTAAPEEWMKNPKVLALMPPDWSIVVPEILGILESALAELPHEESESAE